MHPESLFVNVRSMKRDDNKGHHYKAATIKSRERLMCDYQLNCLVITISFHAAEYIHDRKLVKFFSGRYHICRRKHIR